MKETKDQYKTLVNLLLKERNSAGFWSGQLASSALATAVAIVAFKVKNINKESVETGLKWLLRNSNDDGGFGDTPQSPSNVSTTLLCYASIKYCNTAEISGEGALVQIEKYLQTQNIFLNSEKITSSILKYYGKDYTFSVPILSMLVICRVLDKKAVQKIPQLPYEFTLFPNSFYKFLNMQMVSYAMPALVAVGIFVHNNRTYKNPLIRLVRDKAAVPALRKLNTMVPESGGFLEAIPLTAFVNMCLVVSGFENSGIVDKGIQFLQKQQRRDGSWPIDTDLSTWVTTLAIKSFGEDIYNLLPEESLNSLRKHLISMQYKEKHPFNQAEPGGWGWTNFSGSVPDVDDTSGAILALLELYSGTQEETIALLTGCNWLTAIQNNDGGFPTFCRGWGRLPFDASCADLTGHAIAALVCTLGKLGDKVPEGLINKFSDCISKASKYLEKHQHSEGFWLPLWFGNQQVKDKTNPVYGTAKVCIYLMDSLKYNRSRKLRNQIETMISKAQAYLLQQQNKDGSWGGELNIEGSIEETSLSVSALADRDKEACGRGINWMEKEYVANGLVSKPIGLYFATLWYDEKLYPYVYYIEALRRVLQNNNS